MKMPYNHITFVDHMDRPRGAPVAHYDIRRNVDMDSISVFTLSDNNGVGSVYPMFFGITGMYGSVKLELDPQWDYITQ